ncbi:conjugal transfer protein TraI [Flavitalea sp. BT771]|uniref:conjugal transfer protein TraI n=1 Tax=Flavitalea sp. BT771 TaxID=3063329 RepID=UPI0026E3D223|nr:conjugal transfer protein TraI [Flavitalea sp. BT771]MDO6433283.1 conjugal transfer protein TraI [Flavitalea sp. BT771]MDV6222812.1 conjugal transfer protein TraI [Flavitalea sp. BT771]
MKRIIMAGAVCAGLLLVPAGKAEAQFNIIGEILKRVIMAIDLKIQKEQTKTIVLQDAQKQLENNMQETRLAEIAGWVQQQKALYDEYYQELWQVKNVLRYYSAVKGIIGKEARLIDGYKRAYAAVTGDTHFSAAEVGQMISVYKTILDGSVTLVDELQSLINAFVTQMDDADRLDRINELSAGIDRQYRQLQTYTQENILLSLQRAKSEGDMNMIKALYGL